MTQGELLTFLYNGMKTLLAADRASGHPSVSPALSGAVYRKGYRPLQQGQPDVDKEDIVVAVPSGNDSQFQKGTCLVNVYIPDTVTASGAYYQNSRTEMVEKWLKDIPLALSRMGDIYFDKEKYMIVTLEEPDIHQHFVSLKMDFTLINPDY